MCVFPVSISGFIKFVVVIDNSVVTTQLPRIGVCGAQYLRAEQLHSVLEILVILQNKNAPLRGIEKKA
jgi:hypothetical protein